ncbi:serine hydrolase [Wocania ichthyoenteri]|uniref:serine hydrolase n=1 Tax=Wocania ichthyoenteri TaxID=1230531 RepID=UPI0006918162|nr:serine hydrolase [Wocania ichthyoenteri]
MKSIKSTTTLLLLMLSLAVFSQDRIQKIDSIFSNLYSTNKFNGNILIAEKGNIIYKKSFGLANEDSKEKLNENSIFELASSTKPFTAMAIMILKEQGKLKIDDKITKHLPELSNYDNITIRNLINHTGGLPDYMSLMNTTWNKNKIATNKDVIKTLKELNPNGLFEPNTKVEYSNTGYVLLATIIERASGQTYANFLDATIFKPLKMTRTFVYNRILSPRKINNYASGYIYVDGKYILPNDFDRTKFVIWLDGIVGDGSINSTTIDLLKWDRALYSNTLVSKKSMEDIFNNGTLNDGTLTKHAFGWRVLETEPFGKIARHSGGWPGYVSYIERNLDNDKTVIILQNHYNRTMPKQEIRNILYGMPLPKTMKQLYIEGKNVDEIIALLENPTSKYLIDDFYENSITTFGYQLLKQDKNEDALKVFKYITMSYPKSTNAFDSLGECLLKMSFKEQAIKAYKKALELDYKNKNAEEVLSKLKKE